MRGVERAHIDPQLVAVIGRKVILIANAQIEGHPELRASLAARDLGIRKNAIQNGLSMRAARQQACEKYADRARWQIPAPEVAAAPALAIHYAAHRYQPLVL